MSTPKRRIDVWKKVGPYPKWLTTSFVTKAPKEYHYLCRTGGGVAVQVLQWADGSKELRMFHENRLGQSVPFNTQADRIRAYHLVRRWDIAAYGPPPPNTRRWLAIRQAFGLTRKDVQR